MKDITDYSIKELGSMSWEDLGKLMKSVGRYHKKVEDAYIASVEKRCSELK